MSNINWKRTASERRTIDKIVDRTTDLILIGNTLHLNMDITACHLNGCPLDLDKLLKTDDFTFIHDVTGISNCIDRKTGKLTNNFIPRCSKKEVVLK